MSAGVPMAVWSASRQASTAVDRFVGAAGPPDATLVVCPPNVTELGEDGPAPCFDHRSTSELATIRDDPAVEAAARYSFRLLEVGASASPKGITAAGISLTSLDDPAPRATLLGDPVVLSGRLAGPNATHELMATEPMAARLGVVAGSHLFVRFGGSAGRLARATVTGIVRTPVELLGVGDVEDTPGLLSRAGFLPHQRAEAPIFYGGVAVWLRRDDGAVVAQRVQERLGQIVVGLPTLSPDEQATIRQATDYESRAGSAVAGLAAIVAIFFVGQAVSRQARAEAGDGTVLGIVGMTRRDRGAVGLLRWTPVALGGAAAAALVAVAASALGPFGVARRGVWDHGFRLDVPVLLTGGASTAVLVLVLGAHGSLGGRQRTAGGPAAGRTVGPRSPVVRTGVDLARRGFGRGASLPLVSAVAASAVAIAAIVAATGASSSLRLVTEEPQRFGAPWQALVQGVGTAQLADQVAGVDGVAHAALVGGTDVRLGDEPSVWVEALFAVPGAPVSRPVVLDGREPIRDDEIALAPITMRRTGAEIGDRVRLEPPAQAPVTFAVVGVAMVTDGAEPNVGHGAITTPAGMERIQPGTREQAVLAIGIDPDRRAATLAALRERLPGLRVPFPLPATLENAERVAHLPLYLAFGAAALAGVTFVHALVVSVRRSRRELAVCRVLGFTGRQVRGAVSAQASLLALVAIVLGVPLGVIGARWGWRALSQAFGVGTEPRVPVLVALASGAVVLVLANLSVAPAARLLSRRRTAEILRSE